MSSLQFKPEDHSATFDEENVWAGDLSVLDPIAQTFKSIYRKIAVQIDESRVLAAMRDALLPKLMSGELAVEKVEGF